jgi:hypothetical protein
MTCGPQSNGLNPASPEGEDYELAGASAHQKIVARAINRFDNDRRSRFQSSFVIMC